MDNWPYRRPWRKRKSHGALLEVAGAPRTMHDSAME